MKAPGLILASGSKIRRQILQGAGLNFSVRLGGVDEDKIKKDFLAQGGSLPALASTLALAKAKSVDADAGDIIIGADQIMEIDGILFDKPKSMKEARARLLVMRGREHRLIGAVAAVRKGSEPWLHIATTKLTVREFSESFLDDYLGAEGKDILNCVGGYKFEGRGAQLFDKVEGDFFSILGLSLLPLLAHLRDIKAIVS